jgi:prepilin-type N-terminal cleavage/methylation domain-containing protein
MVRMQAGFTLIEILVGAAIGVVLLWGVLAMADRTIGAAQALDQRLQATAGTAHLAERLESDASSALAIYVPATDVFGNANADGHEADFYSEDASHRPYAWAYTFDANARTITRYAIAPGSPPAAGEAVAQIDGFTATPATVADLANAASPAYDPLFANAHASDVPYAFPAMPQAVGGNRLVALQFTASGVNRRILLASPDTPTAFTVVVTYTPSPTPIITPTPSPLVMTTP